MGHHLHTNTFGSVIIGPTVVVLCVLKIIVPWMLHFREWKPIIPPSSTEDLSTPSILFVAAHFFFAVVWPVTVVPVLRAERLFTRFSDFGYLSLTALVVALNLSLGARDTIAMLDPSMTSPLPPIPFRALTTFPSRTPLFQYMVEKVGVVR